MHRLALKRHTLRMSHLCVIKCVITAAYQYQSVRHGNIRKCKIIQWMHSFRAKIQKLLQCFSRRLVFHKFKDFSGLISLVKRHWEAQERCINDYLKGFFQFVCDFIKWLLLYKSGLFSTKPAAYILILLSFWNIELGCIRKMKKMRL